MYNPTRRNRNIGTEKQGYGQNNELSIPKPCHTSKTFYERLDKYEKLIKVINDHKFTFVIENTRKTSKHACTVDDIAKIISNIPKTDFGDLELIILRQPKRKEETLSPVWGRLAYSFEFENEYSPAIIIEAIDYERKFKWGRKLSPDDTRELERIKADGHKIKESKKYFEADYELDNVRNTQLYRTLLHEFGHYVHYLEFVERPGNDDEEFEYWNKRNDKYFNLPKSEKEKFAHNYAHKLRGNLTKNGIIPFERIEK